MADEKDPAKQPISHSTNSDKGNNVENNSEVEEQQNETVISEKVSPAELFNAKSMPKMPSKKSNSRWLWPTFITLLIIIALLSSAWTYYQQQLFSQDWTELQNKINTQMSQQSQTIEQASQAGKVSLQAANQSQLQINQLAVKNQQLVDSLLSTQEKIKALSGRQKQDWMLAEAAYLIKIAQLQLSLQKDKSTAIQLLRTADSRIIEIADNSLFPIREAIAKDLSNLSLIMDADITGISLALNAISLQVPKLELLALEFEQLKENIEDKGGIDDQQQGFDLGRVYQNFLSDFVVVTKHDEAVKPLMTADQRTNLNSNIQLAIQQAQIALLQGRGELYRLNIENAINWVDTFFKHNDNAKQVVLQLNELNNKPIEVHYPDRLNAQKSLQVISRQQLYQWLEGSLSSPVSNTSDFTSEQVDFSNSQSDTSDTRETQAPIKSQTSEIKNIKSKDDSNSQKNKEVKP